MKRTRILFLLLIALAWQTSAQVRISIEPSTEIQKISPYIFGRNNNLSDKPNEPVSAANWQLYRDAGLQFFREGGGNNSTKYNWKKKLSSHPDWYNNVYDHDWDYAAQSLNQNMPQTQGMWSFQLIGYAASTNSNNFDDWEYNQSQWTSDCSKNWCGGGEISKYLEPWDAEATTGILTHWFDELKLPKEQFLYWSMDNEPEVWNGTHDDVITTISADDYLKSYIDVAVRARTLFPDIKIVGPVFTNEWQWYNWNNNAISSNGKSYSWVEYFIKSIAEAEQRTGLRLLDVLDFHFYPNSDKNGTLQLHRVFYDTSYNFPGANGVKRATGAWDNNQTKEYIFKRATDWLTQYKGANHGVTMGLSEYGAFYKDDPNVTAVHYASLLGTFAQNNVELFSPWDWHYGFWEVMHLFTRYGGTTSVKASSSNEEKVSAYVSINEGKSILSVTLVNRDQTASHNIETSLAGTTLTATSAKAYRLSNLPNRETFKSATDNALQTLSNVSLTTKGFSMTLPPLSVTMVRIPLGSSSDISAIEETKAQVYYDSASASIRLIAESINHPGKVTLTDLTGRRIAVVPFAASGNSLDISIPASHLSQGVYLVTLEDGARQKSWKVSK